MFLNQQTPKLGQLRLAATVVFALLLSACGAGGAIEDAWNDITGTESKGALEITTESVPAGTPGVAYDATQLTATGAQGPVVWTVGSGTLPPGMELTEGGQVTGMPNAPGFYEFTAQATDGEAIDERPLAIAVDIFGVSVVSGLHMGEGWSGLPIEMRSAGAAGAVTFAIIDNRSGGRFESVDAVAGTASWVPGDVGTSGAVDRVRVADATGGEIIEMDLPVVQNPAEHHIARFGSTDVWYLDWDAKQGAHPYVSDLHAAYARLGWRSAAGTDALGSEADRLADLLIRVQVLRELSKLFGRNSNGTEGANGLAISFALDRPGAGYSAPAPGGLRGSIANGYSIMSLCNQSGNLGALGVAYQDAIGNPSQEHNAPGGGAGELGVFLNYLAESVERTYRLHGNDLKNTPVNANDIPALKALLYERPSPGGRYDMLRYHLMAFARSLAYIAAHEVGHSLGLPHLHDFTPGGIMNGVALVGPGMDYFFLPSSLDILRQGLPGPGRGTAAARGVAALAMPAGGVHVCGHCK